MDLTRPVDCILLGRKMTQGFIDAWAQRVKDPETADEFAHKMNDTPKIVFSKTLEKIDWKDTKLAKGDLVEEVSKLKKQEGKDIIAYGGANFVSNLIKYELIDEYYLFVNPAAIGKGMTIFNNLDSRINFKLAEARTFSCGIALLHYKIQ